MKKSFLVIICAFIFAAIGCKNATTINQSEAGDVISNYLKANPEYKTTQFKYGEIKFNRRSEMVTLESYKTLQNEGFVTLELLKEKKKFLSSDSSFTYQIRLTEKAAPYVLKQGADQATVKAITYVLATDKPVNFEQVNSKTSKVTVTLKKENTPFSDFQKDKKENSEFLTKTYKLKLTKEEGWKVNK